MDSAADDLMTASIGRSPRNDPDPPGPHQADFHGLPLDHATKPASTEAQLRQLCSSSGFVSYRHHGMRNALPPHNYGYMYRFYKVLNIFAHLAGVSVVSNSVLPHAALKPLVV